MLCVKQRQIVTVLDIIKPQSYELFKEGTSKAGGPPRFEIR